MHDVCAACLDAAVVRRELSYRCFLSVGKTCSSPAQIFLKYSRAYVGMIGLIACCTGYSRCVWVHVGLFILLNEIFRMPFLARMSFSRYGIIHEEVMQPGAPFHSAFLPVLNMITSYVFFSQTMIHLFFFSFSLLVQLSAPVVSRYNSHTKRALKSLQSIFLADGLDFFGRCSPHNFARAKSLRARWHNTK